MIAWARCRQHRAAARGGRRFKSFRARPCAAGSCCRRTLLSARARSARRRERALAGEQGSLAGHRWSERRRLLQVGTRSGRCWKAVGSVGGLAGLRLAWPGGGGGEPAASVRSCEPMRPMQCCIPVQPRAIKGPCARSRMRPLKVIFAGRLTRAGRRGVQQQAAAAPSHPPGLEHCGTPAATRAQFFVAD